MAYAMPKQNNSTSSQKTNDEQQGRRQDPRKKTMNIPREDTGYTQQGNKVVNMIWKKNQTADRLKYE